MPHIEHEIQFGKYTSEEILAIAIKTVHHLRWKMDTLDPKGLTATFSTIRPTGNTFSISMGNSTGVARVMSEAGTPEEKRDAEQYLSAFVRQFDSIFQTITPEELQQITQAASLHFRGSTGESGSTQQPRANRSFFSLLIPSEGNFVTPILLGLNVLMFLVMVASGTNWLSPQTEDLLFWGANLRSMTLNGEPWRLLTCVFIHIGVVHLLMNMYALLQIGVILERLLGSTRFAVAYFLAGIAASTVSLAVHPITVSAGASGAIFGMYGVFLALLTTNLIEKRTRMALLTSIMIFVVYNLGYGMKEGIDNSAHLGGLGAGVIIGYIYLIGLRPDADESKENLSILYSAGLIGLLCISVFVYIPRQILDFTSGMKRLMQHENAAVKMLSDADRTSKEAVLDRIENGAKNEWQQGLVLADSLDHLDIPDPAHARLKYIKDYTALRLQSCDLLAKSIRENTHAYDSAIQDKSNQIAEILRKLEKGGE